MRKTYKLAIGGAFPRSESGRSYPVSDSAGELLAHAAQASRKDVRDAVVAARKALPGWSRATAYNRGQVIYRIAEMLDGPARPVRRRGRGRRGLSRGDALELVDASIDRVVWYAGWADKFAQVAGSANPIAGPYFNFSIPEPTGVVAIMAPQDSSLLGLVSVLAPGALHGQHRGRVDSQTRPLPAVSLSEVLATSDLPGGVANVLTGFTAELGPWLASHRDVNAIDLTGRRARRARGAAAGRRRQRQARVRPARRRLRGRAGHRAPDRLRRDEDGLAPDRGLTDRARLRADCRRRSRASAMPELRGRRLADELPRQVAELLRVARRRVRLRPPLRLVDEPVVQHRAALEVDLVGVPAVERRGGAAVVTSVERIGPR